MPAPGLAVAATGKTPCTVWPRTVMRGNPRKVNSGRPCAPKSARRTEPSLRNPRFAAHLRCVSAKEGLGCQEGQGNHLVSLPLLSPPPGGGIAHAMSWRTSPDPGGPSSPPAAHRCIGGKVSPLLRVRRRAEEPAGRALSHSEKNLWNFFKKTLDFIVSIC